MTTEAEAFDGDVDTDRKTAFSTAWNRTKIGIE